MENTRSKHFHAKIQPILALFYLCSFIHHHAFTVADDPPLCVACGSPDNSSSQDGRSWTGDSNSSYFPSFEPDNNLSRSSDATQQASSSPEKYFLKARLSYRRFTYIFNVSTGQKFIRLYFYPTSYQGFDRSKAFFSVTAGPRPFTLLNNFSASLTADSLDRDTFFKEFCINVEEGQMLNITFTPSPDYQDAYAFINGIEIVSMPTDLYYTAARVPGPILLGQKNQILTIQNSSALGTVYRINIGGNSISPQYDTAGMYRTWTGQYVDYLTAARPGVVPSNSSINLNFSIIENYAAPANVYQTAMSMGHDTEINQISILTWEFPVDSGFTYFVRLHFWSFRRR